MKRSRSATSFASGILLLTTAATTGCSATPVAQQAETSSPSRNDEEAQKLLFGLVTIPLLPVRLIEAISDGGRGIRDVGTASRELVQIAEEMPREVREELRLALDDTLSRDEVRSAVDSFAAASRSSERLAAVAEELPAVLSAQSQQLDRSLERAEAVAASIDSATRGFADAGRAWTGTLDALNRTLEIYRAGQQPANSAKSTEASSFNMTDVVRTTEHLAATARELRTMVEQTNALIGSDALQQRLEQLNHETQQTVRVTAGSASTFSDQLLWRVTQLMVVVFLLAILWRLACSELRRREADPLPRHHRG